MTAVHELDAVAADIIAQPRALPGERPDLLSTLLQSRDAAGRPMDGKLLRDEVITLLLAGHETTALALTWTLYLLSRHPEVAAKVEEEVDAVVGPSRLPGAADISGLRYLTCVLTEAMRLYPPVYILGREAVGEIQIDGYRLPRGTVMLMSQWVVHRDPRFFPQADSFKPERWGDGSAQGLLRFAYFPFGGGARICIGQPLALMEAKLVLATICQRFRLADARADPVGPFPSVTLRPDRTIRLLVSRRARPDRDHADSPVLPHPSAKKSIRS
jgi:cytochrome P450